MLETALLWIAAIGGAVVILAAVAAVFAVQAAKRRQRAILIQAKALVGPALVVAFFGGIALLEIFRKIRK